MSTFEGDFQDVTRINLHSTYDPSLLTGSDANVWWRKYHKVLAFYDFVNDPETGYDKLSNRIHGYDHLWPYPKVVMTSSSSMALSDTGLHFMGASANLRFQGNILSPGGEGVTQNASLGDKKIVVKFGYCNKATSSSTHGRLLLLENSYSSTSSTAGLVYRYQNKTWQNYYNGKWQTNVNNITDANAISNNTATIIVRSGTGGVQPYTSFLIGDTLINTVESNEICWFHIGAASAAYATLIIQNITVYSITGSV